MEDSGNGEVVPDLPCEANAGGQMGSDSELLAVIAGIQRDVALYGLSRQDLFPELGSSAAAGHGRQGRQHSKTARRRWQRSA